MRNKTFSCNVKFLILGGKGGGQEIYISPSGACCTNYYSGPLNCHSRQCEREDVWKYTEPRVHLHPAYLRDLEGKELGESRPLSIAKRG